MNILQQHILHLLTYHVTMLNKFMVQMSHTVSTCHTPHISIHWFSGEKQLSFSSEVSIGNTQVNVQKSSIQH